MNWKAIAHTLGVMAACALLQAGANYLQTDPTPSWAEAASALGAALVGAVLLWMKSPGGPSQQQ